MILKKEGEPELQLTMNAEDYFATLPPALAAFWREYVAEQKDVFCLRIRDE